MSAVLLGEWGFQGNLRDTSGNGRHGTLGRITTGVVVPPSYVAGPQPGTQAISWGENGQYVDLSGSGLGPTTGGYVSMAWFKSPAVSGAFSGLIARGRGGDSTRAGVQLTDAGALFWMLRWRNRLDFGNSPSSLADGSWHHVATVDGDARGAVFIDGVKIHETTTPATGSVTWESGYTWRIGAIQDLCNAFAGQSITGVRLFSGDLTDSEVVEWMNTPVLRPRIKVRNGAAWSPAIAKRRVGGAWQRIPPKKRTGGTWTP